MSSLVQIITQLFGAQIVARTAQTLGLNPALAQTLATAAVPAVLNALASLATQPDGARRIAEQVQSQDNNILSALVGAVSGQNTQAFLLTGNGMLASLGIDPDILSNKLAHIAGAGPLQAHQILGLVTPAIFGTLAQQDPQIWLSGEGIASLFDRERSAISAALPPGIAAAPATQAVPPPESQIAPVDAPPSSEQMRYTPESAPPAPAPRGLPTWVKLLIPLAILSALMWYFKPAPTPAPPPAQSSAPTPAATQVATELAAFAQKANIVIGKTMAALAGINNGEQLAASAPNLNVLAGEFAAAAETFGKLPEVARRELAGPMQAILAGFREQIGRVRAMAGSEPVRPALDKIETAINGFKG